MTKRKYLYGDEEILDVSEEVINSRLTVLHRRINKLQSKHYLERDGALLNSLLSAKQFWLTINSKE